MLHSVFSPYRSRHTRRLQLHRRLGRLREVMFAMPVPHQGWLREMRRAIGWDLAEVATRLGLVPSSLSRLETSERRGSIRLDNLRRAADALGCELVYVLLPRDQRVLTNKMQSQMRMEAVIRRAQVQVQVQAHAQVQVQVQVQAHAHAQARRPGLDDDPGRRPARAPGVA